MGCGKSLDLIRVAFNYRERGLNPIIYKPSIDTRDGSEECFIKSRIGSQIAATWIPTEKSLYRQITDDIINLKPSVILIDEAQFLTESQVDELQVICYAFDVPIICYGLLVDFQRHLFPGSKRLMEIADDKQELIGICHCGRRAVQNARVVNGKMVAEGSVVQLGKNNMLKIVYFPAEFPIH